MWSNINIFLEKFKNIKPRKDILSEDAVVVIKKEIGIELKKEEISINNFTLFIKTDPIIKNEILLKKYIIMKSFSKNFSLKWIKEIR